MSDFLYSVLMGLLGMALVYAMTRLLVASVNLVLALICLGLIVLKVCYSNGSPYVISSLSAECTCINGVCDEGPLGSGQCLPRSCDVGFTGDNCDIGVPHCGFLNDTCHIYATCQVVDDTEEYVTVCGNHPLLSIY